MQAHSQVHYGLIKEYDYYYKYYDECVRLWVAQELLLISFTDWALPTWVKSWGK